MIPFLREVECNIYSHVFVVIYILVPKQSEIELESLSILC